MEFLFNYIDLEQDLNTKPVRSNRPQEQFGLGLRKGSFFHNLNRQKGGPQLKGMT